MDLDGRPATSQPNCVTVVVVVVVGGGGVVVVIAVVDNVIGLAIAER